jgi:hypothetical protein
MLDLLRAGPARKRGSAALLKRVDVVDAVDGSKHLTVDVGPR